MALYHHGFSTPVPPNIFIHVSRYINVNYTGFSCRDRHCLETGCIELAAAYLAQKPDSGSLKVFSYRGRGPFSYFFPGQTIILNPMFMDEPGMPAMFERLEQADYVVITDTLAFRSVGDGRFVQALKSIPPEHSIYLKGVSPIHIFRVVDLPPSFYETLSK